MRLTFPNFGPVDLNAMDARIRALGISGFTGVSYDGTDLFLEFPDRKTLTSAQKASINEAVTAYVYEPPPAEGAP